VHYVGRIPVSYHGSKFPVSDMQGTELKEDDDVEKWMSQRKNDKTNKVVDLEDMGQQNQGRLGECLSSTLRNRASQCIREGNVMTSWQDSCKWKSSPNRNQES